MSRTSLTNVHSSGEHPDALIAVQVFEAKQLNEMPLGTTSTGVHQMKTGAPDSLCTRRIHPLLERSQCNLSVQDVHLLSLPRDYVSNSWVWKVSTGGDHWGTRLECDLASHSFPSVIASFLRKDGAWVKSLAYRGVFVVGPVERLIFRVDGEHPELLKV